MIHVIIKRARFSIVWLLYEWSLIEELCSVYLWIIICLIKWCMKQTVQTAQINDIKALSEWLLTLKKRFLSYTLYRNAL